MYDGINRVLRRAEGDILAYLNCDEQYLPGALTAVAGFFERHPELTCFRDVVMLNTEGRYLFHRKMQTPLKYHTWTCHLSTLSCAMFFRGASCSMMACCSTRACASSRRRVDAPPAAAARAHGALGQFTSAFTYTGANLGMSPDARRENRQLFRTAPFWSASSARCSSCTIGCGGGPADVSPAALCLRNLHAGQPDRRQRCEVSRPAFWPPR